MQIFFALCTLATGWNKDRRRNDGKAFTVQQFSGVQEMA
jgi:hypothetical protein